MTEGLGIRKARGSRDQREGRPDDSGRLEESELLKALSHPTRVKIFAILSERVASPAEMCEEIGESIGNTGYHCRALVGFGLIELVDERPVRGAVEHFYRAVERPFFDDDCWAEFKPATKKAISGYGIDLIFRDAARALKADTFDSRPERHLSRTPMVLDLQGFFNVAKIQNDALDAILAEQAASVERRNKSGEEGVHVVASMVSFEMPQRPTPAS